MTAARRAEDAPLGLRERSKLERQDRIMLAARRLFTEHGYEATTLRQIATAAGVGLGTLFNYIADKRDLIYLIFNEEMDSVTERSLAAPRPWQTFTEKVLSITEHHYRFFGSEPRLARILLSEIVLQSPGFHLERYRNTRDRLIKGIESLVESAQQAGELRKDEAAGFIALQLYFTYAGSLRWWLAADDLPDWHTGQRDFERLLISQMKGLELQQSTRAR